MSFQEAREYFQEINPNLYGGCIDYGDVSSVAVASAPEHPGIVVPYSGTEGKSDMPARVVLYENVSVERIDLPA